METLTKYVWIFAHVNIGATVFRACHVPSVPIRGFYVPNNTEFSLGDTILYRCEGGLTLNGQEKLSCTPTGWSDSPPFCDAPEEIKNMSLWRPEHNDVSFVNDNKTSTCFSSSITRKFLIEIEIENPAVIQSVRLFLKKGTINIEVYLFSVFEKVLCNKGEHTVAIDQWVTMNCSTNQEFVPDRAQVYITSETRSICEIEVLKENDIRVQIGDLLLWRLERTNIADIKDGKTATCLPSRVESIIDVHIENPAVVNSLRLFLQRGSVNLQVFLAFEEKLLLCNEYEKILEADQWITINCKKDQTNLAKKVHIISHRQLLSILQTYLSSICEIQLYTKNDSWCEHFPSFNVSNGHFEFSRSHANLRCKKGYISDATVLNCKNNVWEGSIQQCSEKDRIRIRTIIPFSVVAALGTLLVIALVLTYSVMIYFIQKKRKKELQKIALALRRAHDERTATGHEQNAEPYYLEIPEYYEISEYDTSSYYETATYNGSSCYAPSTYNGSSCYAPSTYYTASSQFETRSYLSMS